MLKNIKREKVEGIVKKLQVINKDWIELFLGTKHLVPILKNKKLLTTVYTSYIIKHVAKRYRFIC